MLDVNEVKKQAESEIREEQCNSAKERIKVLLRKKSQAQQVVANVERELNDAYAELGHGALQSPG